VPVQPRNREYDVANALATDWFDEHAFKTAWFNAMSITFPLGEKFFIDSVRHYADRIDDPKLREDIRGFCGQEGFHRREHERYNQTLCDARGYDLALMEGRLDSNIQRANRALWQWHAAEEMEHKSVAFDVFRAVGGSEKLRKRAMRQATFFLMVDVLMGVVHMLRKDRKLWNLRLWGQGWKFLFAKKDGILRRVWPAYKEYYRDGFHPWHRDTRPLLQWWQDNEDKALLA
jgi:predicted metal-dependent hydrolase